MDFVRAMKHKAPRETERTDFYVRFMQTTLFFDNVFFSLRAHVLIPWRSPFWENSTLWLSLLPEDIASFRKLVSKLYIVLDMYYLR